MARAGRKRRAGKRHPGGQLVRTPRIDKGTAELQLQRMARIGAVPADSHAIWLSQGAQAALDGTMPTRAEAKRGATGGVTPVRIVDADQTFDPIGRAWMAGLLDGVDGIDPNELRDAGRRFAALYWRKLPGSSVVSSLYANMVSGLVDELPPGIDREQLLEDADARDLRQELALNRILEGLNAMGRDVRNAVDQLALDPFADAGPSWLDWLIGARASALPALNGAIAQRAMLSDIVDPAGRAAVTTIGMTIGMGYDEERAVAPRDWWLFLPASQLLRHADYATRLRHAIDGLRMVAYGGRLTSA